MRLRGPLLVATILAAPLAAPTMVRAQPFQGVYIGLGAGYNDLQDTDLRQSPALGTPDLKLHANPGYVGLGSVGYGFGNGLRVEIEGNYRYNQVNKITGTGFPTLAGGTSQTYGGMVNALFDMDVGFPWLYPYLGLGAGYGWTHLNQVYASGTNFPFTLRADDSVGSLAWQVIAGLSFPIPNVPGLSLSAEYRLYSVVGNDAFDASAIAGRPAPRVGGGNLDLRSQYDNSVLLGVRYAFGVAPPMASQAAPAPVAAPAPAPTRSYIVFFDWDKATLTDRAQQVVREAAENSTRVQYTRIEVNGYTDTTGSPEYNQRLSVRRAQAVAAELVRDGVPRSAISIQGFGETHLLVTTGPGVSEPQNRRVEIIVR